MRVPAQESDHKGVYRYESSITTGLRPVMPVIRSQSGRRGIE